MKGMDRTLTVELIGEILNEHPTLYFKLTQPRKTKYGDYTFDPREQIYHSKITLNNNLTPFFMWLVFLHEYAHYLCKLENWNIKIKPHGREWMNSYRTLLEKEILKRKKLYSPQELIYLKETWQNPKIKFPHHIMIGENEADDELRLADVKMDAIFYCQNKGPFKKIALRRVKYLCLCTKSKKEYLIHKNAPIELVEQ